MQTTITLGGHPLKTNEAGLVSLTDLYQAACQQGLAEGKLDPRQWARAMTGQTPTKQPSAQTQPTAAQALAGLRRRLEKAELEHLREHITELAERLEWAERATARAEDSAEYWREQCESLIAQLGNQVGMTVDGDLVAMPVEAGGDLHSLDLTQGGAA